MRSAAGRALMATVLGTAVLSGAGCAEEQQAAQAPQAIVAAGGIRVNEMVRLLALHSYADVERSFSVTLRTTLPAGELARLWSSTEAAAGTFVRAGSVSGALREGEVDYRLPLTFAQGTRELLVTFSSPGASGEVTAFAITGAGG